jgi:hypothetical protein
MTRCGRPWKTLGSQEQEGKLAVAFSTAAHERLEIANYAISTFPPRRRGFLSTLLFCPQKGDIFIEAKQGTFLKSFDTTDFHNLTSCPGSGTL